MENGMPEGADQAEKWLLLFITRQLYDIVFEQYGREHMLNVRTKKQYKGNATGWTEQPEAGKV